MAPENAGGFNPDAPAAPPKPETAKPKAKKASEKRSIKMGGVTVEVAVSVAKGKGAPGFGPESQAVETIILAVADELRASIKEALGG